MNAYTVLIFLLNRREQFVNKVSILCNKGGDEFRPCVLFRLQ